MYSPDATPGCEECPLVQRREFLRDTALTVTALFASLGTTPANALAAPIRWASPIHETDEEKAYPIPAADGAQIDKSNAAIIARWQGKVYVYSLACPHQNTGLKWYEKDSRFECPKHHSRFEPDGVYIKDSGRATRGLDRFSVRRDGGNIVANLDKLYQQDDNEAEWKTAFITL